jgi:hypothetical protein
MKIRVKETHGAGILQKGESIESIMDENKFEKLYGADDLKLLIEKGHYGDTIGQGSFYYAEIVKDLNPYCKYGHTPYTCKSYMALRPIRANPRSKKWMDCVNYGRSACPLYRLEHGLGR